MELAEDNYYNENVEYQRTGNNVNLRMDELVDYVFEKIQQYEYMVKATESVPSFSPFRDPIIYTTKEGKTVQIPEDVQREAIRMWKEQKSGKQPQQKSDQNIEDIQELPINQTYTIGKPEPIKKKKKYEEDDSSLKYFLMILIFIGIIFYFYRRK